MKGAIAWMAKRHVAANLLMLIFVVGGIIKGFSVKQEVFPEISLDRVQVAVEYPGAAPEEIEEGIILKVEESISGIDGIREITASASEGRATITAELAKGTNADQVLQDVRSEVDRITTFPEDAEKAVTSKVLTLSEVITIAIHGEVSEKVLREQAEMIREELLRLPGLTQVKLAGVRDHEISIDIPEENLRKYGLTTDRVAAIVNQASRDLPGGKLKTKGGEILIRTKERKYVAREYAAITVLTKEDGTRVALGDIATIRDTFADTDLSTRYKGKPAALVKVYRTGDQKPIQLARTVLEYAKKKRAVLPEVLGLDTLNDTSEIFASRMNLLFDNAKIGLVLVVIVLGLFLEARLSFWVMLGLPISFMGGLFFLPFFDTSINMASLFAFILVLGIVVDDAIVVGENIYEYRQKGLPYMEAAIKGAREMAAPVTFSILTTVAAFTPLAFLPGTMGKFMRDVPIVVISILMVSLIESLFVLPAHLSNGKKPKEAKGPLKWLEGLRSAIGNRLDAFARGPYRRFLDRCVRYRYATTATGIALLMLAVGIVGGGVVKFNFMPEVEGDQILVKLRMPPGTPVSVTERLQERIVATGLDTITEMNAEQNDAPTLLRNLYSIVGGAVTDGGPGAVEGSESGSHMADVALILIPSEMRTTTSADVRERWREKVGEIPGADSLIFETNLVKMGADIDVEVSHRDFRVLEEVTERLKKTVAAYPGVRDLQDTLIAGKRELKLELLPEARTLGITETELARQVRGAFYGSEALRLQIGRNEVKVMVRYPEEERRNLADLENLRIRLANGGDLPLSAAAKITESRGYSTIHRTDQKRVANITASVDSVSANAGEIIDALKADVFPGILEDYQGLQLGFGGEEGERADVGASMREGFLMALLVIFMLLAIPFNSYFQPILIMIAIPFGVVGAIFGHLVMGYDLSMLSLFGVVALSGVVVNDSLLIIDRINENRKEGMDPVEAVLGAGQRRLRPILLTSLTTFFGLVPMILETSVQAQFLIPMAISLAFGILFATGITLVLIPALYLVLEDVLGLFGKTATAEVVE